MNKIRYWWYHFIYVPIASLWDDFRYGNELLLPPAPCQICGKPGHKERYCQKAKEFGFLVSVGKKQAQILFFMPRNCRQRVKSRNEQQEVDLLRRSRNACSDLLSR